MASSPFCKHPVGVENFAGVATWNTNILILQASASYEKAWGIAI